MQCDNPSNGFDITKAALQITAQDIDFGAKQRKKKKKFSGVRTPGDTLEIGFQIPSI